MAMSPLLRLFELLKARGLLASLTSGRNHATRKTSRDRSSGRVLARIESIFRRLCPNLHKVHLLVVAQLVAQQAEGSAL
jgi:hypothetical protein